MRSGWWKKVLELSRGENGRWFRENVAVRIGEGTQDGWSWLADPKGKFSVNSAYRTLCQFTGPGRNTSKAPEFLLIWKAPAPFKAKTTVWRLLRGRMATCDNLLRRQVITQNTESDCMLCKEQTESSEHLFFRCPATSEIWYALLLWLGKQSALQSKVKEHLLAFTNLGEKSDTSLLLCIWICSVWCIWKERNECKFNQGVWKNEKLVAEIKSRVWGWIMAYDVQSRFTDFRTWFTDVKLLE
ncbi:uncharacterized protein LOC131005397 [Salvia miltiorrhiza]|uniref:uncharacterized protein LOC131005397 n=1 Tax=Salvia miltiorrhiza TaxID=226208 RepID=UPI0025AD4B97|nr:uncharacterized protein LOC131005397 [Salvia miltiorrhiza]